MDKEKKMMLKDDTGKVDPISLGEAIDNNDERLSIVGQGGKKYTIKEAKKLGLIKIATTKVNNPSNK